MFHRVLPDDTNSLYLQENIKKINKIAAKSMGCERMCGGVVCIHGRYTTTTTLYHQDALNSIKEIPRRDSSESRIIVIET